MGVYCATAASGNILRLVARPDRARLGIASMQSCGTMEVINAVGQRHARDVCGVSGQGRGDWRRCWRRRGITGVPRVFEGEARHPRHVLRQPVRPREDSSTDLGTRYTGGLTLYKRWPAVGTAHSHIHATIELVTEHDLAP